MFVSDIHHVLASLGSTEGGSSSSINCNIVVFPCITCSGRAGSREVECAVGADGGETVVFRQGDGRQSVHSNCECVRNVGAAMCVSSDYNVLASFGDR